MTSRKWPIAPLLALVAFTALAVLRWPPQDTYEPVQPWRIVVAPLAAGVLYLLSHGLRAVRLAVITLPILGLSFRTGCALHLSVAPLSIVLPFKLDELVRLNELRRTGRSTSRAVVTVLIDRTMDGAVLCAMLAWLHFSGRAVGGVLALVVGVGLSAVVVAFLFLPIMLETLQRYVFVHHFHPAAVRLIRSVHHVRELLLVGRLAIGGSMPFLALTSIGIWAVEFAAVFVFMALAGDPGVSALNVAETSLRRADQGWEWVLSGLPSAAWIGPLTLCFLAALMLIWPLAWLVYNDRRGVEPMRARWPQAIPSSVHSPFRTR